jgi:hypothetical protein
MAKKSFGFHSASKTLKIQTIDNGYSRTMAEFGSDTIIDVGVFDTTKHPNSQLSVQEIALIHELGLGVPERSWLRAWFDENASRVKADMAQAAADVKNGFSKAAALTNMGNGWVDDIQTRILSGGVRPALAASTIERKGGIATPLLETGTLASAVEVKVEDLGTQHLEEWVARKFTAKRNSRDAKAASNRNRRARIKAGKRVRPR